MRTEIPFELLVPKPDNARRAFVHVDELALSISEHGLLQNLVVRRREVEGKIVFEVEAGERRRRAIGLLMLPVVEQIKQFDKPLGGWLGAASVKSGSERGGVPCFVIPSSADEAAHLIENIGREDLWPWELGQKLAAWNDAGYDDQWIGMRIQKSRSFVNKYITFGRCLSPAVSTAIEKIGDKSFMSLESLLKICRHYDPVILEPMHKRQVEEFEKLLGKPRVRVDKESNSERIRVHERARRLGKMKVPGHAKLYVRAIYEFLFSEGTATKPDFQWK